jgi:NAD(P)H dehydrogenase (quinone)
MRMVAARLGPVVTIGVSGANGNLGSKVAGRLADVGAAQRLLLRDVAKAPDAPAAELAVISGYDDRERLVAALHGLDAVLMVSGREAPDRLEQHRAFVDAAVAAQVGHVVYTSFYGAAPDAVFSHGRLHWHTEEYIRASGLPFTFLRDNLYADFAPFLAGADGVIRGPAGDGVLSAVAQDDIAEVAAVVLQDPAAHAGRAYDMTGPEDWSLTAIAELLTASLGKPITYHDETMAEAYESRAVYGAPDWEVAAWISTYTAIASGEMAGVSSDIPDLIGRPATSMTVLFPPR